MRLPALEEGLLIASLVLGVERSEVESLIRTERLHLAILRPAAHASGTPIYRTRAEIAKCLFVECALRGILPTPEQSFEFGWLMTQRAVELSKCKWHRPSGHDEHFERFRQQLLEGVDPGDELVRWIGKCLRPPSGKGPASELGPIHISSPMHPPPSQNMTAWANAVDEGLRSFLEDHSIHDTVSTHRPQIYPVQGETEEEIVRSIEERLHTADGLVVLAPHSSWGSAMELETGLRGLIPTLFIYPTDAPPGDRTRVRLEAMEVTIVSIDEDLAEERVPVAIESLVYQWLGTTYSQILGAQRRRESVNTRFARLLTGIRARRTQMTPHEERSHLAAAGLPERRARTLIEEHWGLLSASAVELIALSNAYQVPANIDALVPEPASDRPAHLTPRELVILEAFVDEMQISGLDSVRLAAAAQEEITEPGRRRKLFTDRSKWLELWQRLNGAE